MASFAAMSVAATSVIVAAVNSDGYEATATDLHDGTVWVLGDEYDLVARINPRIQEFDTFLPYEVRGAGLFQDATNVYVQAPEGLARVSVTGDQVSGRFNELPDDAQVVLGGGVGAIASGAIGSIWVFGASSMGAFKLDLEATASIGPDDVVEVTTSGTIIVVDPASDTYRLIRDGGSAPVVDEPMPFGHDLERGAFTLSTVGDEPIVLTEDGRLLAPERAEIDLGREGELFALQLPGPDHDDAVVTTDRALLSVGLESGEPEVVHEVSGDAAPARPARAGGCVHSVWSLRSVYARACGDGDVLVDEIDNPAAGVEWRLRVNRDQVALEGRDVDPWTITDDGLVRISNWQDFQLDDDDEDDRQEDTLETEQEEAECQEVPGPPEASNDVFGARPGITTVLPVLNNDRDPNCDPMAVQLDDVWDADDPRGRLELIDQGQAFQFTPSLQEQTVTFRYIVDDGRGGTDTATATIEVSSDSDAPPQMLPGRTSETIVELGKSVTYNVLVDWFDPDGDQLVLEDASVLPGAGSVRWARDGSITYTAADTAPGPKEIAVRVSDGHGNIVADTLSVSVNPAGTPLPPTARDDYVQSVAGRAVVASPLLNDTDPNDDVLTVSSPVGVNGVRVSQIEGGRYRLLADEPGTYLLPYEITDGNFTDEATIRLTVTAADEVNRPPVAVRDSVVTRVGRPINADVLANDYDADGDVLLVTDARLVRTDLAGVRVRTIDRRLVRVEVDSDPGEPIIIEYTASDGAGRPALGQVVVNVTSSARNQSPEAVRDEVRVRVDDIVDIPVLANDFDPDGDPLALVSAELSPDDQPGVLWSDGRTVRYRAGSEPGRVLARYTIDDSPDLLGLSTATGTIIITVIDDDEEQNQPPEPPPLEGRVFAGAAIRIPVPSNGVDPDGDSVSLVKWGNSPPPRSLPPQLGVPTVSGNDIVYQANTGASGQDEFTYEVEDREGARAVGVVRVVVESSPNKPPSPVSDVIRARPGRELQVPVLANDSDPDGDPLSLVEPLDEVPDGIDATIDGTHIRVLLPFEEEGTWQIPHRVTDGRSSPLTSLLTVVADESAPLLAPIARDDPDGENTTAEVVPGTATEPGTATVGLLDNDDDPDGSRADLRIGIPDGQGVDTTIDRAAGQVTVTLTDRRQVFAYSVTDLDGNVSFATVTVPKDPGPPEQEEEDEEEKEENRPPELRADLTVPSVVEGEPIRLTVDDFVVDPDGDDVQLAGGSPTSDDGEVELEEDDFDSFVFTPATDLGKPTVVVFVPVTDRPGEPDATVTLPFEVAIERANQPPEIEEISVDVQQLGDPTEIDLVASGYVRDPEGDPLSFALGEASVPDVAVSLTPDGVMRFEGQAATVGATGNVSFTVTDNEDGREPVAGTASARVISSTAPLAVVSDAVREDIRQGEPETIDVLSGAFNPFPDRALTVVDASLLDGDGQVGFDGQSVTFTPAPDFFGAAEVTFTVEDGTGDSSRHVFGTLRYTVIGRPLQTGQPTVVEVFSETAVIEWEPADPQGSPILDYTVEWEGGSLTTGGATSATIEGLTNNEPVSFMVHATNAVGDGPPSQPSEPVIPDEVPPPPGAPRIVSFGDGSLAVEWDEVIPNGSPVIAYHLRISTGETETLPASTLSFTWEELANGTDYTFSLVAENDEGRGDPGPQSDPLSPAREPAMPEAPTLQDVGNNLQAAVRVTWPAPAANGREISEYTVRIEETGETHTTVDEVIDIQVPPGTNYTFSILANNAVGPSERGPASEPFPATVEPAQPPAPAVEELDGALRLSNYQTPDDGGSPIQYYQYDLNGDGNWQTLAANGTIGGLANGASYQVRVRAFNGRFHSPVSGVSGGSPFGPPFQSGISISAEKRNRNDLRWSWNVNAAENGRPITRVRVVRSGGVVLYDGASLSGTTGWQNDLSYSTTYNATVTVYAEGGTAQRSGGSIRTDAAPPPPASVSLSWNGSGSSPTGTTPTAGSRWVSVTISNATPGATTVRCRDNSTTTTAFYSQQVTISSGGSYSSAYFCFNNQRTYVTVDGGPSASLARNW